MDYLVQEVHHVCNQIKDLKQQKNEEKSTPLKGKQIEKWCKCLPLEHNRT